VPLAPALRRCAVGYEDRIRPPSDPRQSELRGPLERRATVRIDRSRHELSAALGEEQAPPLVAARAAGVLIEFERGRPIIVDRPLYRELVKTAIKRTHDDLEAKATSAAKDKKASRADKAPADPTTLAKRERDAQLRELTDQAHGANTDLGHALIHNLTTVDPTDITVAKFFVYAVLGADHDRSPYTQTGERIARIAAGGVRLVIDELRTDVTKTRKDGTRGRLRYDYGEHRDPQAAIAWLWKYIDGAKTAGELYGRALVVIAAEQYATRLVVPSSQRLP